MPAARRSQRAGLGPFVLTVLPCPLTFDSLGFTGASTFVHTMEIGMRQMNGHYGVPQLGAATAAVPAPFRMDRLLLT